MKRIGAIVLALGLALCLTACGGDGARLAGSWVWRYDMAPALTEELGRELEAELDTEAGLELRYVATFGEDGSFTLTLDRDAARQALADYLAAQVPALTEDVYRSLAQTGMSRTEADRAMADEGTTVEDFAAQMLAAAAPQSLIEELAENDLRGYFRASGGKLYLSDAPEQFDKERWISYTLQENELLWTDPGDVWAVQDAPLPMRWLRQ